MYFIPDFHLMRSIECQLLEPALLTKDNQSGWIHGVFDLRPGDLWTAGSLSLLQEMVADEVVLDERALPLNSKHHTFVGRAWGYSHGKGLHAGIRRWNDS